MDPLFTTSLFVVLLLVLLLPFGAYVVVVARRPGQILSRISTAVGGTHRDARGSATLGNTTFHYEYQPGGRHSQPLLIVSVPALSGARFEVTKEKALEKLFKTVGLSEEVQTGDGAFDNEFFLVCDSAARCRAIFFPDGNRNAVRQILGLGYESLTQDGGTLAAALRLSGRADAFDPAVVIGIVPHLGILAESIRLTAPPGPAEVSSAWNARRVLAFVPGAALVVVAAVSFAARGQYPLLDDWEFALASLRISLPAIAVYGLVAFGVFRGPAASPRKFVVQLVLTSFGFPLLGWFGGAWLNGYLDRGTPTLHTVQVVERYTREGKRTTQHVRLQSWRPGHRHEDLASSRLYSHAEPGRSLVAVTTKPGLFGFEWVVSAVSQGVVAPASLKTSAQVEAARLVVKGYQSSQENRPDEAAALLTRAIQLDPASAEAHYQRGAVYARRGRYGEAKADLNRVIELDPRHFESYRLMDWLLARQGAWDEIIGYWDRFIALEPNNGHAYLERAGTYRHKGDLQRAFADLDKACGLGNQQACAIERRR